MTAAEDAFGISVGREQLGLYSSDSVRGFSPLDAGNARIDGLYFDPVFVPNSRVAASSTIRVGLSAQGYPFAAPTGILDYSLRHALDQAPSTAILSADARGGGSAEADISTPIIDAKLAVSAGALLTHEVFGDGSSDHAANAAIMANWRPSESLDVLSFLVRQRVWEAEAAPVYAVNGEGLPPVVPRGFNGPYRPLGVTDGSLAGIVAKWRGMERTAVSLGVFRSAKTDTRGVASVRTDLREDGSFRQFIILEEGSGSRAVSGELKVSRDLGRWGRLHLTANGRHRRQIYGGGAQLDLGIRNLNERIGGPPVPAFLGAKSRSDVRQATAGVAYNATTKGWSFGAAALRTAYRKRTGTPDGAVVKSSANPWLLSGNVAKRLTPRLTAFGSFAQGLEESAPAPSVAVNRGEPVPAIRTGQREIGARWAVSPGVAAVMGLFELKKPYFDLDGLNRYGRRGVIRNRGLELSLAGALSPRLNIVAGSLFQDPRLTSQTAEGGNSASRPTALPRRLTILNLDWRLPGTEALSGDLSMTSTSSVLATTSGRTAIPGRTVVSLGGRYRFRLAGSGAVLRVMLSNVGNVRGFALKGAGAYAVSDGRAASTYLSIDF